MRQFAVFTVIALTLLGQLACNNGKKVEEAVATPEPVIMSFNARYNGVEDEKWEIVKKNDSTIYEADFKANGKNMKADFDADGNFLSEK